MQVKGFSLSRNDRINKIPKTKLIQCGPPSVQTQSINPGAVRSLWVRFLNGGFGEGDSQVLVASHVVVVKVNQGLDGLFHCWHLNQSHFPIPEKYNNSVNNNILKSHKTFQTRFYKWSSTVIRYHFILFSGYMWLVAVEQVYVLEKLESFHSASSVGEEQPQIILRHILAIKNKDHKLQVTEHSDVTINSVTGTHSYFYNEKRWH